MFIAVLEDDERREEVMRGLLAASFPRRELIFFDNAPDMVEWLGLHLAEVALLCLDHDLGPNRVRAGAAFDPGSGRDVVDFLAPHPPSCPVLIHTSNAYAAPGMIFALESGGWSVERVVPFDDLAWLARAWARVVEAIAGKHGEC